MRALAFLLGARAIDVAQRRSHRRRGPEPDLPPLASTPAQARAWRRWADAGRTEPTGLTNPVGAGSAAALERGMA
jgi:hypothetical protein